MPPFLIFLLTEFKNVENRGIFVVQYVVINGEKLRFFAIFLCVEKCAKKSKKIPHFFAQNY